IRGQPKSFCGYALLAVTLRLRGRRDRRRPRLAHVALPAIAAGEYRREANDVILLGEVAARFAGGNDGLR
ncbi:MAG: hypothetical protein FWD12_11370, partial [Alphaproteobacteria bacterium]|nr:hypothetical protein [Alphaproteobacteria bacterium]